MQMKIQRASQYMVFSYSTFKETVLLLLSLKVRTLNDRRIILFCLAIEASRLRRSLSRVLNHMRTILYPRVLLWNVKTQRNPAVFLLSSAMFIFCIYFRFISLNPVVRVRPDVLKTFEMLTYAVGSWPWYLSVLPAAITGLCTTI